MIKMNIVAEWQHRTRGALAAWLGKNRTRGALAAWRCKNRTRGALAAWRWHVSRPFTEPRGEGAAGTAFADMKVGVLAILTAIGLTARAGDVMADFETQTGLPSVRTHDAHWRVCVTNLFAASGQRSLYWGGSWAKGLYEYPAVTVPVPECLRDWRGYDRLSIDVFSTGEKFDKVFVRLPGNDNWGVTKTFYAPANAATRLSCRSASGRSPSIRRRSARSRSSRKGRRAWGSSSTASRC